MKLRKLKRLRLDRSCYVELPAEEEAELPGYELYYRAQYPGIFHSRVGLLFFFEMPHAHNRDQFLTAMEDSFRQMGVKTERTILYLD
jgi:hypothetical protein